MKFPPLPSSERNTPEKIRGIIHPLTLSDDEVSAPTDLEAASVVCASLSLRCAISAIVSTCTGPSSAHGPAVATPVFEQTPPMMSERFRSPS